MTCAADIKSAKPSNPYVLGIDLGIGSVAAALLNERDSRIVDLYVRTFDVAEKRTQKKVEPLNKTRSDARSSRRRLRRRAHRMERLRRLLAREGLIAEAVAPRQERSPWDLRAEGLDRLLSPLEWAVVIYHIIKHRGFHSTRKSEGVVDPSSDQAKLSEAKEMLASVARNHRLLQESGFRTAGEMVARHENFAKTKRNKAGQYKNTLVREDLADELRMLFDRQRSLGNAHASNDFECAVYKILMARRPAIAADDLLKMVGRCTFEREEYRAPKASYRAERHIWLTKINNIRISSDGIIRGLSEDERSKIISLPYMQAKLTYKQVRKVLGLGDHDRFIDSNLYKKGTDKDKAEARTFFEAKAFHALRKAYEGAGLANLWARDSVNPDRLDDLAYALTVFKEDDPARTWMAARGIEADIIESVLNVAFNGFIRLSIKALKEIQPHMESGRRYDDAVALSKYGHHSSHVMSGNIKDAKIPSPDENDITNPVVQRALNQARKLINAVIKKHGMPSAVHIELSRDLSKSAKERDEISRRQQRNADASMSDINRFKEHFPRERPSGKNLVKWRLYREQAGQCAYTQTGLDLNRLCDPNYVEIDHALPLSRSLDNGMSNKVLVLTSENQNKGNRTPYEYLGGENNDPRWLAFVAWVNTRPGIGDVKKNKLLRRDFGEDASAEFRDRHITDTRYIARQFKTMIEQSLGLSCTVISGRLTSYLRGRWGLSKVRSESDLHHAMDAAVVAACSPSMVQRLSIYSRRGELDKAYQSYVDPETGEVVDIDAARRLESQFPMPWPHFTQELTARLSADPAQALANCPNYTLEDAAKVSPIRVSRPPRRRGAGESHQATIRSAKMLDQGKSVIKKDLTSLKLADIESIVGYSDPRNRSLINEIERRLCEHGDDGKKAFAAPLYKPSKNGRGPQVRKVKVTVTQKSGMLVRRGDSTGVADNGDMLRVDVFTDGRRFYLVPVYIKDMANPDLPNRVIMSGKPESDWPTLTEKHRFMFSLYKDDWVRVTQKGKPVVEGYYISTDRSTGCITVRPHDKKSSDARLGIKTALSVEKFHVDMLGGLHRAKQGLRQLVSSPR